MKERAIEHDGSRRTLSQAIGLVGTGSNTLTYPPLKNRIDGPALKLLVLFESVQSEGRGLDVQTHGWPPPMELAKHVNRSCTCTFHGWGALPDDGGTSR